MRVPRVLVVEKGEPAREATSAAGGMIATAIRRFRLSWPPWPIASARMYPEFVAELRAEAFESPDLREQGTILFPADERSLRDAKGPGSFPKPNCRSWSR